MTKGTDEYFDYELHRFPQNPDPKTDNPNSSMAIMLRPDTIILNGESAFAAGIAKWLLPLGEGTRPSGHAIMHHIWTPGVQEN